MKVAILAFGLLAFAFVGTVVPAHAQAASQGNTTLTGCLSGPNDEGKFVLQTSSGAVELTGSADLKKHVGHEIKVTGKTVSEAGEENEARENKAEESRENPAQEQKEKREEGGERYQQVSKIQMVSDTCTTK